MPDYTYKHLNTGQKTGAFGEAYSKMAFILEGFEVYRTECDDRGIDFVVRNQSGKFFLVQVKTTRETADPYIKENNFIQNDEFIFCAVRIEEGKRPLVYIAKGSDWQNNDFECLNHNPEGGDAGPYYEMRLAARYQQQLERFRFSNYIDSIRA